MADIVAAFMVEQLKKLEFLDQASIAAEIQEKFGGDFVYINKGGGVSINTKVLAKFNQLTGDDAVYEVGNKLWRKRTEYDLPGRRQP